MVSPRSSGLSDGGHLPIQPGEQRPFTYRVLHGPPAPSDEAAWRAFLIRADCPTLAVAPEFFLECCTGQRPFAVLAIDGSRIAAILTGWHEGYSVVSGLTCRPHVHFDPATDHSRAADALVRGFLMESGSSRLVTAYAWTPLDAFQHAGFRVRALTGTVVLDLRQGPQALFTQLHTSRRRNIRHAMKRGVDVFEASNEDDVAAYYAVYRRWRQTNRKQIYSGLPPFAAFAEGFMRRENRRLFLARHGGQIIAGIAVHFVRGGLLENVESASLDESLHLCPNDLLVWKTVEWGCAEGFSRYSMTGAHPFFLRMGGRVVPVYRHRFDRTWLRHQDLRDVLEEQGPAALVRRIARSIFARHHPVIESNLSCGAAIGAGEESAVQASEPGSLVTPRLTLIPLSAELLHLVLSDRKALERRLAARFLPVWWDGQEQVEFLERTRHEVERDPASRVWRLYFIVHNRDKTVIGDVGIKGPPDRDGSVEIHFGLVPAYRRQGCGSEAVQALVRWVFTQPRAQLITAVCDYDNAASIRVLTKLGMRRVRIEGRLLLWYLSAAIGMFIRSEVLRANVKVPSLVWHLSRSRYERAETGES